MAIVTRKMGIFVLLGMLLASGYVNGQANCPCGGDYSPCSCSSSSVSCFNVPMETVREKFLSAPACDTVITVSLTLAADDTGGIPSNVFGSKRIGTLSIRGSTPSFKLLINPSAFTFSRADLTRVTISNCDVSDMSLAALNGAPSLNYLGITSCSGLNGAVPTIRTMPSLTSINFYNTQGLDSITSWPPALVSGLTDIDTGNCGLTDLGARRYLNWLLGSSSRTLSVIYLDGNRLTQLPAQLNSLEVVNAVDVSFNQIQELRTGAMIFRVPALRFYANGNQISHVEAGAIQGNVKQARIMLQNNRLSEISVGAFYHLVEQMVNNSGSLFLSGNPIDCQNDPCSHAWLLYQNRNLLKQISDGVRCSGSNTLIRDLKGSDYQNCPFRCPFISDDRDLFPITIHKCENSFHQCSHDTPYRMNCPPDLVFNPAVNVCDYPKHCSGDNELD